MSILSSQLQIGQMQKSTQAGAYYKFTKGAANVSCNTCKFEDNNAVSEALEQIRLLSIILLHRTSDRQKMLPLYCTLRVETRNEQKLLEARYF